MDIKKFKTLCGKENVQIGDLPPFCKMTDKQWKSLVKIIGKAKRGELKGRFTNIK